MAINLMSPLSIINCLEMVLAIVIGGLLGRLSFVGDDESGLQLIIGVTYGYFIISIIVVISNILREDLPKYARLLIACSGVILYVTSGGLQIDYAIRFKDYPLYVYMGDPYDRLLAAGAISIIQALLYMADGFFTFKSTS